MGIQCLSLVAGLGDRYVLLLTETFFHKWVFCHSLPFPSAFALSLLQQAFPSSSQVLKFCLQMISNL
jgi:hypothetical protein